MAEPALPPARYEQTDVTFRFVLCGTAVVLGIILLCMVGVMWLYPDSVQDQRLPTALPVYPEPRLQADPSADLQRFTREELGRLDSTGWVDKTQGVTHISIDDAMRRIAEQGIPDWPRSRESKP